MKFKKLLPWFLILIMIIVGIVFYPRLPESVASHWNERGEVNGYMTRFWGAFFVPLLGLGLVILFKVLPQFDPKYKQIKEFQGFYDEFVNVFVVFFLYLYVLTLLWNLGLKFDFISFLLPALAVLFFEIGRLTENAKPNWSIGVRTPWTLSSDTVWYKTNRLAGKLFKICAVLILACLAIPTYAFFVFIPFMIVVALGTVVYSYVLFYKEQKKKN